MSGSICFRSSPQVTLLFLLFCLRFIFCFFFFTHQSSISHLKIQLPMTSPQEREKKAEIFFEKFNVPSLCLLPDWYSFLSFNFPSVALFFKNIYHIFSISVLNMYNTGKQTGLVVDIGRSVTRISLFLFRFISESYFL